MTVRDCPVRLWRHASSVPICWIFAFSGTLEACRHNSYELVSEITYLADNRLSLPPADGVAVLHRPSWILVHGLLSVQGPVGFAEHLSSEKNKVRRPRRDDLVGLLRLGDESDGPRGDTHLGADGLRELRLIVFTHRDL